MATQNLRWKRIGPGSLFGIVRSLQNHGGQISADGRFIIYTVRRAFTPSDTTLYERIGDVAENGYRSRGWQASAAAAKAEAEKLYAVAMAEAKAEGDRVIAEAQAKGEQVHILDEFESAPIPGAAPAESPALARLHAQAQANMMEVVQDWQRSAYHANLALKAADAARKNPDSTFAFMRGSDARYEATLAARYALRAMDFPFTPIEGAAGFHHHEV